MKNRDKIIFIIVSGIVWIYLLLRAYYVPIVHDEAATFYYYIQTRDFLPFIAHPDANNHILNSALSCLFYIITGSSKLSLRLANLIFFPVYAYYIYKISCEIKSGIIKWSFLIILLFTHNFIEFFGISRGYGMSMGLLTGMIYYLISFQKNNQLKNMTLCLVFGILAVTANLSLLTSFLIVFILLVTGQILNINNLKTEFKKKSFILITFLGILSIGFFTFYMNYMKKHGLLYYGRLDGLWEVTIKSIAALLTDSQSLIFPVVFTIMFVLICIIFIAYVYRDSQSIRRVAQRKILLHLLAVINRSELTFFLLLTGNISAIIILARILRVNYPEDRTGLYLFIYFTGSVCFLTDKYSEMIHKKYVLLVLLPFAFFVFHFITKINLSYISEYKEENIPERFFKAVHSADIAGDFPKTIGGNHMRLFCWSYMNYRAGGNAGIIDYWNYPETDEDYQIAKLNTFSKEYAHYYDVVDYDKNSNLSLLKRKKDLDKLLISEDQVTSNGIFKDEYLNIKEIGADTIKGKSIYAGFKFTIKANEKPFEAWVVAEVRDKSGNSLAYEYISLNWLKPEYNGEENNFINGLIIHTIPDKADKIVVYLWNINKAPFEVKGKVYEYEMK